MNSNIKNRKSHTMTLHHYCFQALRFPLEFVLCWTKRWTRKEQFQLRRVCTAFREYVDKHCGLHITLSKYVRVPMCDFFPVEVLTSSIQEFVECHNQTYEFTSEIRHAGGQSEMVCCQGISAWFCCPCPYHPPRHPTETAVSSHSFRNTQLQRSKNAEEVSAAICKTPHN